jgi:hypothetical protein
MSLLVLTTLVGCKPSDILSVPPPAGVEASSALQSQSGAEAVFAFAKSDLFVGAFGGGNVLMWTTMLSDEATYSAYSNGGGAYANIDARMTTAQNGFYEQADNGLENIMSARPQLLIAAIGLHKFESASGQSKAGEAYALTGYAELILAEQFCAGVPLSADLPQGGIAYGQPLTTDSLLGVAEAHFDSALAYAAGDNNIIALANVGLGRTRLDRGHYADAATAVKNVATSFVYNSAMEPSIADGAPYTVNVYSQAWQGCTEFNVSDREGINGLNFRSAGDPRLVFDSTSKQTCDGAPWYYPVKFGDPPNGLIPLATGVEARLIESEAALQAGQAGTWAADLNALRSSAPSTYLQTASPMAPLTTDSTTGASAAMQIDVLFRERAFWLYGIGTRVGDLRRLIRQYKRDANTVFPSGPFPNGSNPNLPVPIPNYGTDVSLTLPTPASFQTTTNPYYKGCLQGPGTA